MSKCLQNCSLSHIYIKINTCAVANKTQPINCLSLLAGIIESNRLVFYTVSAYIMTIYLTNEQPSRYEDISDRSLLCVTDDGIECGKQE